MTIIQDSLFAFQTQNKFKKWFLINILQDQIIEYCCNVELTRREVFEQINSYKRRTSMRYDSDFFYELRQHILALNEEQPSLTQIIRVEDVINKLYEEGLIVNKDTLLQLIRADHLQQQQNNHFPQHLQLPIQQNNKINIDDYLLQEYERSRLQQAQINEIEEIITQLVQLLSRAEYGTERDQIQYQYFGSYLNGFGMKKSDVDFTILTNSYVEERPFLNRLFQQIRHDSRFEIKSLTGQNIRVPLLSVNHKFKKKDIDICVNNILGALNTKLLSTYAKLHKKIQQAGILIKIWAKNVGIQTTNIFSSYALVLMLISFLQRKYNLPILQDINFRNSNTSMQQYKLRVKRQIQSDLESFDTDCFFLTDQQQIAILMKESKEMLDRTPLSQILIDFWRYYAENFRQQNPRKISISKGLLESQQVSNPFSIEDPFDINHDPGERVFKNNHQGEVQKAFSEASRMLNDQLFRFFDRDY